jgi:hypothetical protein
MATNIGTGPQDIPLNQFLGEMAFMDNLISQGSFTPTLQDAPDQGGNSATVATAIGWYVKIGPMVQYTIRLTNIDKSGMTANNQLYIGNLPFPIKSTINAIIHVGACDLSNFNPPANAYNAAAFVNASGSDQNDIRLFVSIYNAGHDGLEVQHMNTGTNTEIFINISVPVAS